MQDLDITLSHGVKLLKNDFDEFEKEIGSKLPDDFKEFYLKHNGGMPSKRFIDSNHEASQFFNIGNPIDYSILSIRKVIHESNNPKWGIVFASDPFGNNFILDLRSGNSYGNIWFFDHEKVEPPTVLAKTFKDFINSLKSEEEVEDE